MANLVLPAVPALDGDAQIIKQHLTVAAGGANLIDIDQPLDQLLVPVPDGAPLHLDAVSLFYTNKANVAGPPWSGAIDVPAPPAPPPTPPTPAAVTVDSPVVTPPPVATPPDTATPPATPAPAPAADATAVPVTADPAAQAVAPAAAAAPAVDPNAAVAAPAVDPTATPVAAAVDPAAVPVAPVDPAATAQPQAAPAAQ